MMSDEISAKDIRANSCEEIFHVVNWEVGKKRVTRVSVVLLLFIRLVERDINYK